MVVLHMGRDEKDGHQLLYTPKTYMESWSAPDKVMGSRNPG